MLWTCAADRAAASPKAARSRVLETLEVPDLAESEAALGRPLAEGEWSAVVLQTPNMALLLPRGAALGPAVRCVPAEMPGLTLRQLLSAIHAFYAVRMPPTKRTAHGRHQALGSAT